ncbi:MAG TPA: hypothetical protein P5572_08940 [Phycisphaerae bacterium]|nr:hypothetical protein [Phycisphaerales bacterium]HRX85131.1 hypothetical protein [Phycisphaerae bacterium]
MKRLGVVVVLGVLLFGLKLWHRGDDGKQILKEAKLMVLAMHLPAEEEAYLTTILEREHQKAFDAAYDMGRRRRAATFYEDKYLDAIFAAWIRECQADGKPELADKVAALQAEIMAEDTP